MRGILFSEMIDEADWDFEFNRWYDEEHIPARLKISGFETAVRYRLRGNPRHYLAVYWMANTDVLKTPEYRDLKREPSTRTDWMLGHVSEFTRYIGQEMTVSERHDVSRPMLEAPCLYPVFFSVPSDREDAFNRWYDEDHVPTLLQCSAWWGCWRYRLVEGEPKPRTHLALHFLGDWSALDSPERQRARLSPWRERLAEEPWFAGSYAQFDRLTKGDGDGFDNGAYGIRGDSD